MGYLGKRIDILNGYWEAFVKTHRALGRFPEFDESNYNTEDEFSAIELIFSETADRLQAEVEKLRPKPAPSNAGVSTADSAPPQAIAYFVVKQIN